MLGTNAFDNEEQACADHQKSVIVALSGLKFEFFVREADRSINEKRPLAYRFSG